MSQVTTLNDERLIRCFSESLGLPISAITEALAYQGVNQWDSISHMALVAALESEFGVMLDTDEILALSSVGAAREILRKHAIAV